MNRLKVLIGAYACRPGEGSEPGIGWNTAIQMAQDCEVWVITRSDNRPYIEADEYSKTLPQLHFIYYDLPSWAIWWKKGSQGVQLHYYLWQIGIYSTVRRLHREVKFQVIHHVTYVKYWSPCFISLLEVPFIWGPVGGGEAAPASFQADFDLSARKYEILRSIAQRIGETDPFTRLTARRSARSQATTKDTAARMRNLGAKNVEILPAIALSIAETEELALWGRERPAEIVFLSIGRLLHWKGFHLGIRAFAAADLPPSARYWIIGEGEQEQNLKSLAAGLGIGDRIRFLGQLSRTDTLKTLKESIALVHPSLHDSGGLVCLEAMAASRPVICLDLGGPGMQVTPETGFKIAATNPEQSVRDLAAAMTRLVKEPELARQMGIEGQKRVRNNFTWEAKRQLFRQIYAEVEAGKQSEKV